MRGLENDLALFHIAVMVGWKNIELKTSHALLFAFHIFSSCWNAWYDPGAIKLLLDCLCIETVAMKCNPAEIYSTFFSFIKLKSEAKLRCCQNIHE